MSEAPAEGWDCHVHVFDGSQPLRAAHYPAVERPLQQIEALALGQGVGHLVLVQPSVYGNDNRLLLEALAAAPGRHRGVVVVDPDIPSHALDAMHRLGVRGVRFNLVSPAGEAAWPAASFAALAPRLRERGWHVQWYAQHTDLARIAELHRASGLVCVLDHLAGCTADLRPDDPCWHAVDDLAAQGAWVKLSGLYRLKAVAPYAELAPTLQRLASCFAGRLVWGSDWPHTLFPPEALPAYGSTWQPVVDALGPKVAQAIRCGPPAIYA